MVTNIDVAGLTDVGRKRDSNQDQFLIADLSKSMQVQTTSIDVADSSTMFGTTQGKLFLVADGMGGHASGEKASAVAVSSIATYILNTLPWARWLDDKRDDDLIEDLKAAIEFSNEKIMEAGRENPENSGMGTTATMAFLIWPRLFVVHVGDSRCYLIRDNQLECMTRDHTFAEVFSQASDENISESSRLSNVLWNVLGGGEDKDGLTIEIHKTQLQPGDKLLLCSDGLNKHLSNDQIAAHLRQSFSANDACNRLVEHANQAGGSDNITVIVSHFEDEPVRGNSAVVETHVPLDSVIESC